VAVLAELWWFKNSSKNGRKKLKKVGRVTMWRTRRRSKVGSGSGRVGVVSVDRGDRDASNGGGYRVAVAVLSEIRSIENRLKK
jgi:hypothetical protein